MSLKNLVPLMRTLIALYSVISFLQGQSQTPEGYPIVGQPIPEFRLTDVQYYTKKYFDPQEVRGKWIILDFWNSGCTSCVQSFPKVDALRQEFNDHAEILLVGQNDKNHNKNIKQNFSRYTKNLGLTLPIAYDTALFKKFKVGAVPHIIIVDPDGIVYAISPGSVLTRANLQDLIGNKKPVLIQKSDAFGTNAPAPWRYLGDDSTRQDNFLYQSVLSVYHGEQFEGAVSILDHASQGFFKVTGTTLSSLYKFAWFGQAGWLAREKLYSTHWSFPILEIADSAKYKFYSDDGNNLVKFNFYMSVARNQSTREGLMKAMQSQLKNYFGYTAFIETRSMPYWKLTATDEARKKLKSVHPQYKAEFEAGGIQATHVFIRDVVSHIISYSTNRLPIFDETEIVDPIDISFTATMIDIYDVQKALKKHGLVLEKSQRPMKVLVIRDLESCP